MEKAGLVPAFFCVAVPVDIAGAAPPADSDFRLPKVPQPPADRTRAASPNPSRLAKKKLDARKRPKARQSVAVTHCSSGEGNPAEPCDHRPERLSPPRRILHQEIR